MAPTAFRSDATVGAFRNVLLALADWRHEAIGDPKEFARRDRQLDAVQLLFFDIFGPLGDRRDSSRTTSSST